MAASLRRADEAWRTRLIDGIERRASTPRERLLAVVDWLREWFSSEGFRGCAFINAAADLPDDGHPAHVMPAEHKRAVRKIIWGLAREGVWIALRASRTTSCCSSTVRSSARC